jgi:hypothetical protein
MNNKIIQAMTSFGNTNRAKAIYDSVVAILHNAQACQLIFIDEKTNQEYQPMPDRITQMVQAGFPATLLVKNTDNIIFKIDIGRTPDWDCISLYPLEPYRKKKGIDCLQEQLDLAFYIECILKLCESFVIWEFIAE